YYSENRDINFLFSWQNILNQFDKSTFDLFEKSIMTIKNSFFLDGIYCFSIEKGIVDVVFSNADIKFKAEDLECINDIINAEIPAFMINKYDGVLPEQKKIIDILESNSFMTILGVPYKTLNDVNYYLLGYAYTNSTFASNKIRVNSKVLQVVKIVFGQFIDAVWRIESDEEIKSANNKLKDMATRDMLTGLYNRQGYVSNVKELCAKDYNRSVIMYFDLDNFKYYNDNFGHDMGDMILVEFAKILLNCEVGDDFAVRYGGDEFLLILGDKDLDYSEMIAERIYKKLRHDMNYQIENKAGYKLDIDESLKLTCSIGIAPINVSSVKGVNEAMKCADKALYSVKNAGKGQYKIYSE
ncbi:MAG: GGDEF domain-containing protein, partial [Lachnospiraceae bacterium]|nr:GGDEF domain-containing protein [Lachnospiraceae bacterium]